MTDISNDILFLRDQVFATCGFKLSKLEKEIESSEYQAYRFKINNKVVIYRHAKITPTKIGSFVTLWKRAAPKKPIQPFDSTDNVDLIVVAVKKGNHIGQFIFPKLALIKHGILSVEGKGGKRALRVYPPWDITESNQAKKTQAWQLEYFANIQNNKPLDINRLQLLYSS